MVTSDPVRDRIMALTRSMSAATRATRPSRPACSGCLSSNGTTTPTLILALHAASNAPMMTVTVARRLMRRNIRRDAEVFGPDGGTHQNQRHRADRLRAVLAGAGPNPRPGGGRPRERHRGVD